MMDSCLLGLMRTALTYLIPNGSSGEVEEHSQADRYREIILNAISLACGFIGNFFLLLNFTRRIKYIVALPFTIIFWFLATGIVSAMYDLPGDKAC